MMEPTFRASGPSRATASTGATATKTIKQQEDKRRQLQKTKNFFQKKNIKFKGTFGNKRWEDDDGYDGGVDYNTDTDTIPSVDSTCDSASHHDTSATSSSSSASAAAQQIVELELADLKIFGSGDLQGDQDSIRYNFQEFIHSILLAKFRGKWSKTSTLMSSKGRINLAINQDYTEILLDQSYFGRDGVEVHLLAANHVFHEFLSIQPLLVDHTSMALSLQEMIFSLVEEYIRPRIADHYSMLSTKVDTFSPGDTAKVVTWIDSYLTSLANDCPEVRAHESWSDDRDQLVTFYMEQGVRREMRELLGRSHRLETNLRLDKSGHAVSSVPEDIIFLVDAQIRVAKENLPPQYTEQVLHICNEELRNMVGDVMLKVGTEWKQLSSNWYCALINDASRLAELCEDRNATHLFKIEYQVFGESVAREFAELSLHAVSYLCERVMSVLREPDPILTSIGDEAWENDNTQSAVECTIATLNDYFGDLERWLAGSYFYPKVLKHCFDLTLKTYVESFFSNTLARGVKSPTKAAEELNQDYIRLALFFNGMTFGRYHSVGGYYSPTVVNEKLHIIRCLSKLVNPCVTAEDASNEIKFVIRDFRDTYDSGSAVIFHLVGLRKKHSGRESVEWLRVVSNMKKALSLDEGANHAGEKGMATWSHFYNLVDLRNSKFLHNVRPAQRELRKKISVESIAATKATTRMLLTKPANQVQRRLAQAFKTEN